VASAKTLENTGQRQDYAARPPGKTFYEWGFETGLHFYERRRPPSGILGNLLATYVFVTEIDDFAIYRQSAGD
jgi:hypothetical protein